MTVRHALCIHHIRNHQRRSEEYRDDSSRDGLAFQCRGHDFDAAADEAGGCDDGGDDAAFRFVIEAEHADARAHRHMLLLLGDPVPCVSAVDREVGHVAAVGTIVVGPFNGNSWRHSRHALVPMDNANRDAHDANCRPRLAKRGAAIGAR